MCDKKECPWCGEADPVFDFYELEDGFIWCSITCLRCRAETADQGLYEILEDAVDAEAAKKVCAEKTKGHLTEHWNSRAEEGPNACPFCGGTDIHVETDEDGAWCLCAGQPVAGECCTKGPFVEREEGASDDDLKVRARAAWNRGAH